MEPLEAKQKRIGEMLADLPAHSWTEAARRLDVIASHLESGTRTADAARRAAASIGIGLALFYRLARIWSRKEARPYRGGGSPMAPALEAVVSRAIGDGDTSQAQVARAAGALAEAEGLPAPARNAVRLRYVRQLAGRRLRERMDVDADLLIDRAHLDLRIADGARDDVATLTCLFDLADGAPVAHALTIGDPSPSDVADLVGSASPDARVAFSLSDRAIASAMRSVDAFGDARRFVPGRWRVGSALRAAFGPRLGRMRLLEHAPVRTRGGPVASGLAGMVVDELLLRTRIGSGSS